MKERFDTATKPNFEAARTMETSKVRHDRSVKTSLTSFLATNLVSNPERSFRKGFRLPLQTPLRPIHRAPDRPLAGLGPFIHVRKRLVLPIQRRYSHQ